MTDSWFATNLYSKMHKLTYPWRPWIGQTWTFIISESFQISFTFFRLAVLKRIFKFMITPHLLPFLIIIPWQRRLFIWKKNLNTLHSRIFVPSEVKIETVVWRRRKKWKVYDDNRQWKNFNQKSLLELWLRWAKKEHLL